jgi:putative peptide maturation dehydrogenase
MAMLERVPNLILIPRPDRALDLASIFDSEPRLRTVVRWMLLTAERDGEFEISFSAVCALGSVESLRAGSREDWIERFGAEIVAELERSGALRHPPDSDAARIEDNWHPIAQLAHRHLRWRGVDSEAATEQLQASGTTLLASLGPAPPIVAQHPNVLQREHLERLAIESPFEEIVNRRATCRNFDTDHPLDRIKLSQLMQRVYGARAISHTSGVPVMKRAAASAGGLHAVEAYLLVQRVEGLAPGLYHYHPIDHALDALKLLDRSEARQLAARFVANQAWFVDAPVQVVLVARFARNFWKYRRHAKTHRALFLDAGHLSHHQYLVATELGMAAFITAAVNEGDIEDAFGLDPMQEGVIAVTGFGRRGERMDVLEFDPLKQVWPEWSPE